MTLSGASLLRAITIAILAQLTASQTSTVDPSDDPLLSLSAFGVLPPCAATALSYEITGIGSTSCQDPSVLTIEPSCVCESTGRLHSSITKSVRWSCGSSDDAYVTSATKVLDMYCDFEEDVDFRTTWASEADVGPWEIEEIGYLPGCASELLRSVAASNTYLGDRCPTTSGLKRECMCSRTNVLSQVKSEIEMYMDLFCDSEDDTPVAENVLDGYCNRVMNGSNAEFPTPTGVVGDMTYYIDAMPQYASLSVCAQLGLSSAIFHQTSYYCPSGAQGLASCACLKPAVSAKVVSSMIDTVSQECSDGGDGLTEAMDVFGSYCSAVRGEATVSATQSVTETLEFLRPNEAGETGARNTGVDCDEGDEEESCDRGGEGAGSSGSDRTGIIAGAVVGGVVLIALLIGIAWFIRRRKKRASKMSAAPQGDYTNSPMTHQDLKSANFASEHDGRPISELPTEIQPSELYVDRSEWGHPLQGQQK